jgi:hypothetical protein
MVWKRKDHWTYGANIMKVCYRINNQRINYMKRKQKEESFQESSEN